MNLGFTVGSWQLSLMLSHPKTYPELKLPTEDEIKAMLKQAYQKFKEAIKKAR